MAKVLIDPVTRIEGHLSVELDVVRGKVSDAQVRGDMFRGFEMILKGRNPVDANQITQRICGVCPVSHGIASSRCLDDAFKIRTNRNGRLMRNLVLAGNFIQSHILHFYQLSALDYVDITAVLDYQGRDERMERLKSWARFEIESKKGKSNEITAVGPFLPRYEGEGFYIKDRDTNLSAIAHYLDALDIRLKAHKLVALFGGRVPHLIALVPGGVTETPDRHKIREFRKTLREIERFVTNIYLEDVIAVAKAYPDYFSLGGFDSFLTYGAFEEDDEEKTLLVSRGIYSKGSIVGFDPQKISEHVMYSRYNSGSQLHPSMGDTEPDPEKKRAYSWLKAPRYNGKPYEVGPLARTVVGYLSGNEAVKREVDTLLSRLDAEINVVFSALGRHACRALECRILCARAEEWLDELETGKKARTHYEIPDAGSGMGLTEAPRGALGHWIRVKDKIIDNYQCVVPTTWFCSPRDDRGVKGPVEQALIGTPISDPKNPIEAVRVVKSFDPCIACAVHVMQSGMDMGRFRIC